MPSCIHQITKEVKCSLEAVEKDRCAKHHAQYVKREEAAGKIKEGGCSAILTKGKRCQSFAIDNGTLCTRHNAIKYKAQRDRERIEAEDKIIEQMAKTFINDAVEWRLCVQLLLEEWRNRTVSARTFWQVTAKVTKAQGGSLDDMDTFYQEIRFMEVLPYQNPNPVIIGELQRLASDTQNVHTKEVAKQTNELTELLLKEVVPEDQRTLQTLTIKFARYCKNGKMGEIFNVLTDVNLWYEKKSCLVQNDMLYKRLLDAAICKIEKIYTSKHDGKDRIEMLSLIHI